MRYRIAHELSTRIRAELLEPLDEDMARALTAAALQLPGVSAARASVRARSLVVEHDGRRGAREAVHELLAAPRATLPAAPRESVEDARDDLLASLARSAVGSALGGLPRTALAALGALPFLRRGLDAALARRLDADLLDASAMLAAFRLGEPSTAGLIGLLLRLGDYIRAHTEARTRRDVASLLRRERRDAWVIRGGREVLVPHRALEVGDVLVVREGHAILVDGVVISGRGLVNQAALTGESEPVRKRPGATVCEGTTVVEGTLEIRAQRVGDETRLARIGRMIEAATQSKALVQADADRLADKLVPYIFSLAGGAFLLTGDTRRAASILLVDYSCALKLCVPLALKRCLIEALAQGVLFRGGKEVEALAAIDTLVLDKTGTLTEARPRVAAVELFGVLSREELIRDTACVEEHFPHPVAAAILRLAESEGLVHGDEAHGEVKHVVAEGVVSTVRGRRFVVGSRRFLRRNGVVVPAGALEQIDRGGHATVLVGVGERLAGAFQIEDPVRADAAEALAAVRALGVREVVMLTGDSEANARRVARVGVDRWHAEVTPEEKAAVVRKLRQGGAKVAMLGDGMNDAPALAEANVGISFQHGADVARETADVVLLGSELTALAAAMSLARAAMDRVAFNFRCVVGLNSAFIAGGAIGLLPPATSAVLHNATTVVTSLGSLRPYGAPLTRRPAASSVRGP